MVISNGVGWRGFLKILLEEGEKGQDGEAIIYEKGAKR